MKNDPFEKYYTEQEPGKKMLGYIWQTAIGLQAVDGLSTSAYLIDTARQNIEGEITLKQANERITAYYEEREKHTSPKEEEADKVSARISQVLSESGFVFSPVQYLSIHEKLFRGLYDHAGEIRDYNISKKEWVLNGASVQYGGAAELRATLQYDFEQEKAFQYQGLSLTDIIRHIALFVSRLWQIHVFGEGNTRTTAVFLIMYLRSLGFDVTNDVFAENAWYFRNALVRANYNDLKNGIRETIVYLEMFLRNLLLGEKHALRNRDLHVGGTTIKQDIDGEKQNIGPIKQDIDGEKQDIEAVFPYDDALKRMNVSVKTTAHVLKMYQTFGKTAAFGRSNVCELLGITASPASTLLKKLLETGIITLVTGLGKGKYRFI